MKIGVLSDTHGFLGLHAGDIGDAMIELELKFIAPVTIVLGNTDLGLTFKETELVTLAGKNFLVHHIVNPRDLSEPVADRIKHDRPDVVVFGHTHRRSEEHTSE